MSETNPILFEVIAVDGAIEKRDPDELISFSEMQALNEEFIMFLEERGYGFGGVLRGIEPSLRRRQAARTTHPRPVPPPEGKDSSVSVREGGRPIPMPTTAVHPLERAGCHWCDGTELTKTGLLVGLFLLALIIGGILLLAL